MGLVKIYVVIPRTLFVYLFSCNKCNMQQVGETTTSLNEKTNIQGTAESGCQYVLSHFKESGTNGSFGIQILEKLYGMLTIKSVPNRRKSVLRERTIGLKAFELAILMT